MLLHYPRRFGAMRKDDLRTLSHQVRRRGIGSWVVAARDAKYELQIAALAPSEGRKPLRESGEIALRHRVALRKTHEHPDPSHPRLLPPRRERPRRRTTEQRYELAACHCPMPPVLPTERIAHLGTADSCIHPPGRYETIAVTPPITFSKEVAQKQATPFPRQDLLTARNRRTGSRTFGDTDDGGAGHRACTEDPSARED